MYTQATYQERHTPTQTIIVMTLVVLSVIYVPSGMALEYEVGTQMGSSYITPPDRDSDSRATILQAPSGAVGGIPASAYISFFPHRYFAVSPEINFTRVTNSYTFFGERNNNSQSKINLGCQLTYFPLSHTVSTPYLYARMSWQNSFGDKNNDDSRQRIGLGGGYQWRIENDYYLRFGLQYHRAMYDSTHHNGYSAVIGLGVRFGNGKN